MQGLVEFVKTLGASRIAAMGAVTIALIGFFVFLIMRVTTPQMTPLFTDLTYEDSAAIVKELDRQAVPYELRNDGNIVLVPAISPLTEHRALARTVHADAGFDFVEVFCDTPLADCERRDPKGLYAKARAGEITHFTGIDSPYQRPKNPDLRLTPDRTLDEQAQLVIDLLEMRP